jgi:hypothetical protein
MNDNVAALRGSWLGHLMRARGRALVMWLMLAAMIVSSGCGLGDRRAPGPTATRTPERFTFATEASSVVLEVLIDQSSAPVSPTPPPVTVARLTGDGKLVVDHGMVGLPQHTILLTDEGVQTILRLARDAGLLDPDSGLRLRANGAADVSTHVITVTANGDTTVTRIVGLGPFGVMRDDEREVRARILSFLWQVEAALSWLPPESVLDPGIPPVERLNLSIFPDGVPPDAPLVEWPQRNWPLAGSLGNLGSPSGDGAGNCTVIEGADAIRVLEALAGSSTDTRWISADGRFVLYAQILDPGDVGCAPPGTAVPAPVGR